ncbi:neuropeptide F-like isoform X2 [Coccinella septempunctata]|uniref:neuropeptide F-like isoform X2 n=1 Tax=Coccinella septempunctata TaxID=41139 RepID=UPI001D05E9C6|nr:neuropeptide F-like isoform X2 [Coccinella septempunctata]
MRWQLRIWWVALLAAMVVLESRLTEAAPRMTRREDMLKDLMKLDQYYSSIARPRYGKRAETAHMLPLDLDFQYQNEDNADYATLRR